MSSEVLGPGRFITFGFKRPLCPIKGCKKPAEFFPVLVVHDPRGFDTHGLLEFKMCVPVCEEHRFRLTMAHVISDTLWAEVLKGFKVLRGVVPNKKDARLVFETESGLRYEPGNMMPMKKG